MNTVAELKERENRWMIRACTAKRVEGDWDMAMTAALNWIQRFRGRPLTDGRGRPLNPQVSHA